MGCYWVYYDVTKVEVFISSEEMDIVPVETR